MSEERTRRERQCHASRCYKLIKGVLKAYYTIKEWRVIAGIVYIQYSHAFLMFDSSHIPLRIDKIDKNVERNK